MLNADALNQLRQLKTDIKANKEVFPGTVKATQGRFGFATLDDGRDIYLPPEQMQRVLPGDRITVSLHEDPAGKTYAEVEELTERRLSTFVGRYQVRGNGHFVAPDLAGMTRWIFIPPKKRMGAQVGQYLHCRLSRHPINDGNAQAEVLKVLGGPDDPGIERHYTLAKFDMNDAWPDAAMKQVTALDESAVARAGDGREDLQHLPFVTIDAASTQDMDDALYVEALDDGWRLWVAIADPTSLVEPDSALDREAFRRTASAYFPGEVRAMLPEDISTVLCSLIAETPRLALVCRIDVAVDGSLGQFQLSEALIRSRAKLSYDQVAEFLDEGTTAGIEDLGEDVIDNLSRLGRLGPLLRQWRQQHALIAGDRPDYRLRLDERGKIRTIERMQATSAHRVVEECMVAANRCAADFLAASGAGLFVTHRGIRSERVDNIRELLRTLVPELADCDPSTPEGFARVMREAPEQVQDVPIRAVVVRQLERAELALKPAPHHGMGLPAYTTFTSPLRKYTDLHVHRLIKQLLAGKPAAILDEAALGELQRGQGQVRMAANDVEQWLKCQYIAPMTNQVFPATITRTLPAGFLVRLEENGIEGFVSVKELGEKYSYDPVTLSLTSASHRLLPEQPVNVKLADVDMARRQVRFQWCIPDKTK